MVGAATLFVYPFDIHQAGGQPATEEEREGAAVALGDPIGMVEKTQVLPSESSRNAA
jgi:hypothetical protein